jgi:DNA-binding NarL/FixJ family response regulator
LAVAACGQAATPTPTLSPSPCGRAPWATGYVLKGAGGPEMLRALRAVASGEAVFGATVAPKILGMAEGKADVAFGLTGREPEVLELVARGLTNDAIARRLFLSSKTIRKLRLRDLHQTRCQ